MSATNIHFNRVSLNDLINIISEKTAKSVAQKESKKTKVNESFLYNNLLRTYKSGIKVTKHFANRLQQRFILDEVQVLSSAISRAIRQTQTQEVGCNHKSISQKIIDKMTGIVVVLERQGMYGAVLVTSYKLGEENLLSDEELRDLRTRGIL